MNATTLPPLPPAPKGLFFADNGAVLCGRHLGATARATGHDIHGTPIEAVTAADIAAFAKSLGVIPTCECCGARE